MTKATNVATRPSLPPPSNGASKALARITPSQLRMKAPTPPEVLVEHIINDFQSDTAEIVGAPDPLVARATLFVLVIAFVVGVAWAAIAMLDRIVTAPGTLQAVEGGIVVQPYDTAIIRTITVKEGDIVKEGSILATLDPTFSAADLAQLEFRLASENARIERLTAEMDGKPYIPSGQAAQDIETLEASLWQQRQREYEARLKAFDESLQRLASMKSSKENDIRRLEEQQSLIDQIETMRRKLVQAETGSKLNLLMAQRESINVARSLESTQAELKQVGHEIKATIAQREVYVKQWSSQISSELIRLRDDRNSLREQISKARKKLDLVQLVTPMDAVVVQIGQKSVGSVVSSGELLFKLVPLNAPLEVEAYISGRDIGYVKIGDDVNVKVDAYPYVQYGMLEGKVLVISEDSVQDPRQPGTSAYKTRIAITSNSLRNVPSTFRLLAGMPLSAEIKVGKRSVLSYFLSPITKGLEEGMREP